MDVNDEINELLLHDADQLNKILEQELRETERVHQELINVKRHIIHQIQATRKKHQELQIELCKLYTFGDRQNKADDGK